MKDKKKSLLNEFNPNPSQNGSFETRFLVCTIKTLQEILIIELNIIILHISNQFKHKKNHAI